jgi:hypothetical protein
MDFYGLVPCFKKKFYKFIENAEDKSRKSAAKIEDILK